MEIELTQLPCQNYKHKKIVNAIYDVLSEYQIEALCDCASWMLRHMLITYEKYPEFEVELISGRFDETYHVWVHDKIENYYIDITSEQFLDTDIFPSYLCSQDINYFYDLGYKITNEETTDEISKSVTDEPYILIDKGKKITLADLLDKVKQKLDISGGKSKNKKNKTKSKNKKNKTHKKQFKK
jgi:hypothetical protein